MRHYFFKCLLLFIFASCHNSCTHWFSLLNYEKNVVSLATLDLFDQRSVIPVKVNNNWKGDWLFRRERLLLVDQQLRSQKPEILLFQSLMRRQDSPVDADDIILKAGSLADYTFVRYPVAQREDSFEEEFLATAFTYPIEQAKEYFYRGQTTWQLSSSGFMSLTVLEIEAEPVVIFNVKFPQTKSSQEQELWYRYIQSQILQVMKYGSFCQKRLIVAGYLPQPVHHLQLASFYQALELKDSAHGFCEATTSSCNTESDENPLYRLSYDYVTPARSDRILLHQSAKIYHAQRFFDLLSEAPEYFKARGITHMAPSLRFGWLTTFRLAHCH